MAIQLCCIEVLELVNRPIAQHAYKHVDMRMSICRDMRIDMCTHTCIDVCIDMRIDIICTDVAMWMDVCMARPSRQEWMQWPHRYMSMHTRRTHTCCAGQSNDRALAMLSAPRDMDPINTPVFVSARVSVDMLVCTAIDDGCRSSERYHGRHIPLVYKYDDPLLYHGRHIPLV